MVNADKIRKNTPVVGANNQEIAVVDHLEGTDMIKLKKDAQGVHHFIPVSWVTTVDDKIHLDRSEDEVMREWTESVPTSDSQVSS